MGIRSYFPTLRAVGQGGSSGFSIVDSYIAETAIRRGKNYLLAAPNQLSMIFTTLPVMTKAIHHVTSRIPRKAIRVPLTIATQTVVIVTLIASYTLSLILRTASSSNLDKLSEGLNHCHDYFLLLTGANFRETPFSLCNKVVSGVRNISHYRLAVRLARWMTDSITLCCFTVHYGYKIVQWRRGGLDRTEAATSCLSGLLAFMLRRGYLPEAITPRVRHAITAILSITDIALGMTSSSHLTRFITLFDAFPILSRVPFLSHRIDRLTQHVFGFSPPLYPTLDEVDGSRPLGDPITIFPLPNTDTTVVTVDPRRAGMHIPIPRPNPETQFHNLRVLFTSMDWGNNDNIKNVMKSRVEESEFFRDHKEAWSDDVREQYETNPHDFYYTWCEAQITSFITTISGPSREGFADGWKDTQNKVLIGIEYLERLQDEGKSQELQDLLLMIATEGGDACEIAIRKVATHLFNAHLKQTYSSDTFMNTIHIYIQEWHEQRMLSLLQVLGAQLHDNFTINNHHVAALFSGRGLGLPDPADYESDFLGSVLRLCSLVLPFMRVFVWANAYPPVSINRLHEHESWFENDMSQPGFFQRWASAKVYERIKLIFSIPRSIPWALEARRRAFTAFSIGIRLEELSDLPWIHNNPRAIKEYINTLFEQKAISPQQITDWWRSYLTKETSLEAGTMLEALEDGEGPIRYDWKNCPSLDPEWLERMLMAMQILRRVPKEEEPEEITL